MGERREDAFPHSFTFPFSSRPVTIALENFEYPWDVQASVLLLLCLLTVFQILFKVKQLFTNNTWRSAPRLDGSECHSVWQSVGTSNILEFHPRTRPQTRKIFGKKYAVTLAFPERHKSLCGAGASPALFNTIGCPQGEEKSLDLMTKAQTLRPLPTTATGTTGQGEPWLPAGLCPWRGILSPDPSLGAPKI